MSYNHANGSRQTADSKIMQYGTSSFQEIPQPFESSPSSNSPYIAQNPYSFQNVTYLNHQSVQMHDINNGHYPQNLIGTATNDAYQQLLLKEIAHLRQQLSDQRVQLKRQMEQQMEQQKVSHQIETIISTDELKRDNEEFQRHNEVIKRENEALKQENEYLKSIISNTVQPEVSYVPLKENRMQRNIFIQRELTQKLRAMSDFDFEHVKCHYDHKGKKCKCDALKKLYSFLDIAIAMQFNNTNNQINNNTKIINSGLVNRITKKDIYLMIEAENGIDDDDEKQAKNRYKWKINENVYENEDMDMPPQIRKTDRFQSQLQQGTIIQECLMDSTTFQQLINKAKWCKIPIFSKKENNRRRSLLITKSEFVKDLRTKNNFNDSSLIPILVFTKTDYEIHHVMIVTINNETSVGISFIYDEQNTKVKVTGIHIDKAYLLRQHQWVSLEHMKRCTCFDEFDPSINHLSIGNPDDDQNKINILLKKNEELKQEISRLSVPIDASQIDASQIALWNI